MTEGEQLRWAKFLNGGLAGMGATACVQPIDLIKTRMQLVGAEVGLNQPRSSLQTVYSVIKSNGIIGLYDGLSAALLRQAIYATTRLGIYQNLEEEYKGKYEHAPNFAFKMIFGLTAGGIAAFVGTPTEVALIRMMSDGRLPKHLCRGYKNVFDALYRIFKEEGLKTLWRGWRPTVIRAMILNAAQLSIYSQSKQTLLTTGLFQENVVLHLTASIISGFFSTVVSIPVDITKTRLQFMQKNEYSGFVDVLFKVIKHEGPLALWKGFMPYFFRLCPHTVLIFIFMERLNGLWRKEKAHEV